MDDADRTQGPHTLTMRFHGLSFLLGVALADSESTGERLERLETAAPNEAGLMLPSASHAVA